MSVCWIPCTYDCIYQKDGFCQLEFPVSISETPSGGCVYHKHVRSGSAAPLAIPPRMQTPNEYPSPQ